MQFNISVSRYITLHSPSPISLYKITVSKKQIKDREKLKSLITAGIDSTVL